MTLATPPQKKSPVSINFATPPPPLSFSLPLACSSLFSNGGTKCSVADTHPHGFGLLDPHPESAFQMRIPDADADYKKRNSNICDKKLRFKNLLLDYFKGAVQRGFFRF
jgi:hypothetical protein